MLQETATFTITIVLSTENGEIPENDEVLGMVQAQMGGILDDETGLACIAMSIDHRE